MKKTGFFKRLLSFVLCVCMLIPCLSDVLPLEIFAEGEPDLYVTDGKKKVTEIELPKNEKTDLTAVAENFTPSAYGWQVLADAENNVWAKIYDKNEKTIEVSHPLLYTILNEFGGAYLRAVGETEFGRIYSEPVFVLVTDPTSEESEEYVPNEPKRFLAAGSGITITINYLDGEDPTKSVYSPFTATLSGDSTYSQNVLSPTNIGYAPFWTGDAGDAAPTDGDTFEVTVGGETRTYTYDGTTGSFINDVTSLVETDVSWLTALNTQVIASAATEDASIIHVSFDPVTGPFEDVVFNVYYQAIEVPFSVRYYFQNINDDGYTLNAAISYNGLAKTGSIVSDEVLEQPVNDYYGNVDDFGFTPLYHYPEAVAADGSTVFECYYDRNYYLIKFDMNGGYGVEPIYARFGSSFVVTPPTRSGYVFQGWDEITAYDFNVYVTVNGVKTQVGTQTLTAAQYVELGSPSTYTRDYTAPNGTVYPGATHTIADSYGDGGADEGTGASHDFIGSITARTLAYKALWAVTNTTATVVFWRENANDEKFSYWGAHPITVQSNTLINGEDYLDYLASSISTNDTEYFTYLTADKNVLVEGDGSTVVNVYYSRNRYTVLFKGGINSTCGLELHTHTDACYAYPLCDQHAHTAACYDCGLEEVPHTEDCCSLPEHTHTSACLLECDKEEHTHTDACYNCGFAAGYQHTHTAACCAKEVHVHSGECCGFEEHVHDGASCNYLSCTKHVHSLSCYTSQSLTTSSTYINNYASQIANPQSGRIYRYRQSGLGYTNYYNFFYLDGTWYYINNTTTGNTTGSIGGISFTGTLGNPGSNGAVNNVTATRSCGQADHTHTASCYSCGKLEQLHTRACYPGATNTDASDEGGYYQTYSQGRPTTNLRQGQVYIYEGWLDTYKSIYIGDTWYVYNGTMDSGLTVAPNNCNNANHHVHDGTCCTLTEHTHGDGHCGNYICGKTVHTHTDGTCVYTKCGLQEHTHTNACLQCGKEAHVHSEACQYACGKTAHTHTAACCTTEEHTHTIQCYTISGYYSRSGTTGDLHVDTSTSYTFTKVGTKTVNGQTLYYNSDSNQNPLCVKCGNSYYRIYYGNSTGNTIRADRSANVYDYSFTQTCTKTQHVHGDGNCTYGCGMQEHVHNDFCYACGLAEHTHGDGNCNTFACSDPTHHEHSAECLKCGYEAEHVHTADCAKVLICDKPEHNHNGDASTGNSTNNYHYGFVAKYEQDIYNIWPTYEDYTNSKNDLIDKTAGQNYSSFSYTCDDGGGGSYASRRVTMTEDMCDTRDGVAIATFTGTNSSTVYDFSYFFESFDKNGPTTTTHVQYDGKWYDKSSVYSQSLVGTSSLSAKAITGMTSDGTNGRNLYYSRNEYSLQFLNYDNSVISGKTYSVRFEEPIDDFTDVESYVPPYPSTLEENAYEFVGWYTTEGRYPGSEYVPGTTMPAGPVALYAKWVPLTHTVRFFETYDDMLAYEASVESGSPDESLVYVKQTMPDEEYTRLVEHGKYVGSIPNPDKLVVTNPGGSTSEYDFAGWFYIQNESKKAFTPLDMPINGDMNIFADWGTHTAQPYAIHYALDENEIDADWLAVLGTASETAVNREKTVTRGSDERTYICLLDEGDTYHWHRVIADATQGYAYQGTTRTFAAKAGENYHQLYDDGTTDFNEGYYPMPASHSITMVYEENSIEPRSNVFTFRYVYVEEVDYWIRYIDTTTGERMLDSRGDPIADIEKTTKKAVVTERFRPFTDYLPDAFYKQCILAVIPDTANPGQYKASPENVITFYYTPNDSSAKYTVHFLLQNSDEASRTLNASDFVVNFDTDPTSDEYGTYTFSDKFTESASRIDGIADKDTPIPIIPIDFAGFELIRSPARTVEFDGVVEFADATTLTLTQNSTTGDYEYIITPVTDGTDVFLFYQRKPYPYKIYHLLYGTSIAAADLATYTTVDTAKGVLAATESGTALYETDFTGNAKTIDGYVCVTALSITKDITPNEAQNYIVFFYTREQFTAQYKVWSGGGGTLDNTIETIESGSAFAGSTAAASVGYKFEGWFVDADCTIPATYNASTNPTGKGTTYTDSGKTTPAALGPFVYPEIGRLVANGQQGSDGNIFYAKFTPLLTDLVIRRAAGSSANEGIGDQIFVYEIKNDTSGVTVYVTMKASESVAVLRVMEGQYTITQINDWSHRFEDTAQTVTVTASSHTVTFDDPAATEKWLNGSSERVTNTKGATP